MTSVATGGLATPARLLRSRRVHGQVIIGVIGLSALAGLCPGKPGSRRCTPGRLGQGGAAVVICYPISGDRSGSPRYAARSRTSR
jgi:hypothetical protein